MSRQDDSLYSFHRQLNKPFAGPDELLVHALGLMAERLKLDQVCYFRWKPADTVLSLNTVWRADAILEAEEEIYLKSGAPLLAALKDMTVHVSRDLGYPAMYMPLNWKGASVSAYHEGGGTLGALRMERLKQSAWSFSNHDKELALELAEELSHAMSHAELDYISGTQLRRAKALTELSAVFASSLRVEDSLRVILQGIQKYFGFDRVRLYLVNHKEQKLRGEMSIDIRGQARSLSHEEIPLQPGSHRFADIVLGSAGETIADKYRDTVVYLPLTVQGKSVGLLIVDNLLSRNPIMKEDLGSLGSFAGQIALAVDNSMLFERVQELSQYDELTKLPVRRYFMERLQEEVYRAERFGQPVALIWMDLDHFKEVNDTYGHQVGDVVLKEVSRVIMSNLRKIDMPCRYGGDEIVIMLPQSRLDEAKAIANRLSREAKEIRIPGSFANAPEVRVSVSQGVATFPGDAASLDELMKHADEALYQVKTTGRGGVAVYSEMQGNKQ